MTEDCDANRRAPANGGARSWGWRGSWRVVMLVVALGTLTTASGIVWWQESRFKHRPAVVMAMPDSLPRPIPADALPKPAPVASPNAPIEALYEPALIETGAYGPLPRVADDGRAPRHVYSRPFDGRDARSRIVIVVTGLGYNADTTEAAIRRLPPDVSLAFEPYAANLKTWTAKARGEGHELLISIPQEPTAFPYHDPGPRALLTSLTERENLDRLSFLLSRFTSYVGVVSPIGNRFHADERALAPVLGAIADRGLVYVDGVDVEDGHVARVAKSAGLVKLVVDKWIDDRPDRESIEKALGDLEAIARRRAIAVGLARAYPVTIDRLAAWSEELADQDLVLAPVTAAAGKQFRR